VTLCVLFLAPFATIFFRCTDKPLRKTSSAESTERMKQSALTSAQKETLSAFQIKVYEACMQIPWGQVRRTINLFNLGGSSFHVVTSFHVSANSRLQPTRRLQLPSVADRIKLWDKH
jgi:hypothetical protein